MPVVQVQWAEWFPAHSCQSNLSSSPLGEEETLNGGGFLFPLVLQLNKLSSQVWGFGAADQQCRCPGVGQRAGLWAKHPRNADVLLLGPGRGLEQFGGFCGVQSRSWVSCNRGPIPGAAGEQCAGSSESYLHAQESEPQSSSAEA